MTNVQYTPVHKNAKHLQGYTKVLFQIKLMLWKRYRETTKTKWDLAKVIMPPLLFFALLILIYEVFDGLFHPDGIESFFVPIAFWIFVQRTVVQIMYEKSSRLQESMRMMGLSDFAYWASYFIADGVILGFILSFLCALMTVGGLFNGINFGLILGILFVFCLSAISFAFFLTAFFDTPQTSAQATLALLMGFFIIWVVVFPAGKNTISFHGAQYAMCFFPPLALQVASGAFLNSYEGISIGSICGIMFADIFIYFILAWYFAQVWPNKLGVQKPFYFPLQPSYWLPQKPSSSATDCLADRSKIAAEMEAPIQVIPVEDVDENLLGAPVVVVKNLRKSFGSYRAVNDLSFKMYENQIFALLGHNGAGKTTAINVLTGLVSPDYTLHAADSFATIYGNNIHSDMDHIRLSLGVCPQHDVLFEHLTVKEHILFFAQLKGFSYEEAEEEALYLTNLFHLSERLDHRGHELSGGQKRKLSVAIAVCGGSKFVVLDEPTAGMDPLARRELWDLLASLRHGRTMLLTTHYMDEADVLGDRVGIMSLGTMQCMGSTQYLKTTFGAGYKLLFDKAESMSETDLSYLTGFITKYIPDAKYVEELGKENQAIYCLPFHTVALFGAFFLALETHLPSLHVCNFNLTITTLEEVFLKVGEDHTVTPHTVSNLGIGSDRQYHPNFLSQVIGLVRRKWTYALHDFTTIPLLALPVAAIVVSAVLYNKQVIGSDDMVNDLAITGIYMGGYLGAAGLLAEFLVRERADKLRNVLTVMGCDPRAYWLGTFLADYLLLCVPVLVMWITWAAAEMPHYYANKQGMCFFLSLLFTVHLVSFSYVCSFMFTSPKACISFLPILIIILLIMPNIILLIGIQIATAVGTHVKSTLAAGILLWGTMILSPHGAFYCAFLNVINDFDTIIVGLPDLGACIGFMIAESVLFLAMAYYIDVQSTVRLSAGTDRTFDETVLDSLDEDVQAERVQTLSADISSTPLVIRRLRKVFPPKRAGRRAVVAVEDLALSVSPGEIFGLLGANGAGKTTALSMLTRHISPTSGDAFLASHSILSAFTSGAGHLGVVTQSNSLWDRLTVEDHLFLFARLRGVPGDLVSGVVSGAIDQLELAPHRHKLAMRLSGGMKRKLCVAIALIGDPEVVLLDEPSAGLDPVSRHNLWTVILRTMSARAVVLTTHSMEEAEALCSRIGIMVRGQVRAVGTKQHLKVKFGSGFELTVKLRVSNMDEQRVALTEFVVSMFPAACLLNENGGLLTYTITKDEMRMSTVFTGMEREKERLQIEDYTVAQPTLEQVFIRTIQKHTPELAMAGVGSRMEDINQAAHAQGAGDAADAVVEEVNKCGCTDYFTRIFAIVMAVLFVVCWAIAIGVFGRSNRTGSSIFFLLGFFAVAASIVGCTLLCCACCKPPKGTDE